MSEQTKEPTASNPVESVASKDHHSVAEAIFNHMIDDEMLNDMRKSNIIACKLGYKLSCIAEIEIQLEDSY